MALLANLAKPLPPERERSRRPCAEGEGDRVGTLYLLRADPITLTLDASHLDPRVKCPGAGSLPRAARERFKGSHAKMEPLPDMSIQKMTRRCANRISECRITPISDNTTSTANV